jgi:hypothetical protein
VPNLQTPIKKKSFAPDRDIEIENVDALFFSDHDPA